MRKHPASGIVCAVLKDSLQTEPKHYVCFLKFVVYEKFVSVIPERYLRWTYSSFCNTDCTQPSDSVSGFQNFDGIVAARDLRWPAVNANRQRVVWRHTGH